MNPVKDEKKTGKRGSRERGKESRAGEKKVADSKEVKEKKLTERLEQKVIQSAFIYEVLTRHADNTPHYKSHAAPSHSTSHYVRNRCRN